MEPPEKFFARGSLDDLNGRRFFVGANFKF